jgi:hypothetical protein
LFTMYLAGFLDMERSDKKGNMDGLKVDRPPRS